MFLKRRKSRLTIVEGRLLDATHRIRDLEQRLDRVAVRQAVSEVMLATVAGLVLGSVGEDLLRQLMSGLRNNISATASNEMVALEMEERAAQLLDQIERLARAKALKD